MKTCLPLLASLVLAAGCKTEKSGAPAAATSSDTAASAGHGRSGKIDLPRTARPPGSTEAPALPEEDQGSDGAAMSDEDRRARREERRRQRMAEIDTNGDGQISDQERAAAQEKRLEQMQKRMDTDGDGKLTVQELQDSRMARRLGDVTAIDTNKDGIIQPKEMEKALEDQRQRGWGGRRGPRGGGSDDGTPPGGPE